MSEQKKQSSGTVSLTIVSYVLMTFWGYFSIGLPLAILPVYIHKDLGYSTFIAGAVISVQYFVTFFMRGLAGTIVDKKGPKPAVLFSMSAFAVSGILLVIAFQCVSIPWLSLLVLIFARLMTGCAEGMVGASPINWAMLVVGNDHTGQIISYNGIASYGALAIGAPLGVILGHFGNSYVGLLILLIGVLGFFYARRKQNKVGTSKGASISFAKVLKIVAPYGFSLAMGGIGFGCLSTFITLYYAYMHWDNAALCLTSFSVLFIVGRLLLGKSIERHGGLKVSFVSLFVEAIGLLILWWAPSPIIALVGGAITGLGFSLIFPALGVEAVKLAPVANQGSALAAYGLFIDISLGITGPLVGLVASEMGMHAIFPFSMMMVLTGFVIVTILLLRLKSKSTVLHNL